MKEDTHILLGVICVGLGASICAVAFDVLPYDPHKIHAPAWVVALAGGVFVCGGLVLAFKRNEILVALLGNLIVAAFAAVAAWVALYGPAEHFSGGIPFLADALNVKLARVVFGCSAVVCVLMLVPGVKHLLRLAAVARRRATDAALSE